MRIFIAHSYRNIVIVYFAFPAGNRGKPISKEYRINRQIRVPQVLVIDENDQQLGVMSPREAYELAHERSYDLVEVAPSSKPPVCRFMDYGKYRYEQAKAERESKAKRKVQELREVKLKPKVGDHDFDVKAKTVQRLIQDGDRVKVSLRFKGREVVHTDLAIKLLERLFEIVKEDAVITQKPILDGRQMVMVLAPKV
ncbi:MAG: translation initiation factor IF-3 [bacterium]|nr:translation initiation factor IF-3 [bacterium]